MFILCSANPASSNMSLIARLPVEVGFKSWKIRTAGYFGICILTSGIYSYDWPTIWYFESSYKHKVHLYILSEKL